MTHVLRGGNRAGGLPQPRTRPSGAISRAPSVERLKAAGTQEVSWFVTSDRWATGDGRGDGECGPPTTTAPGPSRAPSETAAIADALGDNLVDLDALEFNGREELENEVVRAQRDLLKAQAVLSNVAKFKLPPRSRVALRKTLTIPEIRTAVVGPDARVIRDVAKESD
jgi:hypothetical protein